MASAKQGDTVKVHYTGKLHDGTVFDSSVQREPIEFDIGAGQVIPGFEKAVIGMSLGESKTQEIPSNDAYGPYRDEMVAAIDRQQIPSDLPISLGQQLQLQNSTGQVIPVFVTAVEEETVTLDGNHPLAGKDLIFDIQLVELSAPHKM